MKVCKLIEQLQQLDQDKEILLVYDTFALCEIEIETETGQYDHLYHKGLKEGDYIIAVG